MICTLYRHQVSEGTLLLVNRCFPMKAGRKRPKLSPVASDVPGTQLQQEAAQQLHDLIAAVNGQEEMIPVSGFRSRTEQSALYRNSMRDNGRDFTVKFVAPPDCSEHQIGLAIDMGLKQEAIDPICPDFPNTGICRKFRQAAAQYGFIERYPAEKESITGVAREPWHFRYVGVPHAEIMQKNGLTLEEYLYYLKRFPFGGKPLRFTRRYAEAAEYEIYYAAAKDPALQLNFPAEASVRISGNHIDGFVITIKSALQKKGVLPYGLGIDEAQRKSPCVY